MTRLLRRARPRPGRHRRPLTRRFETTRRRAGTRLRRHAPYAAAGLVALAGATGPALLRTPPPAHPPTRPAAVRRAVPVARVLTRAVTATGPTYTGRATWYGPGFDGHRTASGERFDAAHALTAAHLTLPFGTLLRVCRGTRCVVVRINDRGPYGDAILDLSWLAAERLGMVRAGVAEVTATVVGGPA